MKLPATPVSQLELTDVPIFRVTPAKGLPVKRVEIFYSVDPDPRSRFWRDASAKPRGRSYGRRHCLWMDLKRAHFLPLQMFIINYQNQQHCRETKKLQEVCISSLLHEAKPQMLEVAGVKTSGQSELVIDDFKRGFHDWFIINGNNRSLWQHWTRKVTDPKWRGPEGAKLALTLQSEKPNVLAFVLKENVWRNYRGKQREYIAEVRIKGGAVETVILELKNFKSVSDEAPPKNWKNMDQFAVCAQYQVRRPKTRVIAADLWQGPKPVFKRLEWQLED